MTMLEPLLRRLLEHPKRRFLVIIITCVVGFLFVWPAVDNYGGLRQEESETRDKLAQAQEMVAHATHQQTSLKDRSALLAEMEKREITDEQAYELRGKLVELVRGAGCTLKRIDLANPARRKWRTKDDPLEPITGPKGGEETPYLLRTQQLSLTIAGETQNIRKLLGQLHSANKLIHTQRFSLKPLRGSLPGQTSGGKTDLILEMELTLFGLELEKKDGDKKAA